MRSADFVPEEDEQRLWEAANEYDAALAEYDVLYDDPELASHVRGVSERLLEHMDAEGVDIRIRFLRDPELNAAALPNGTIYLHTGILASLRNDAQLAALLGHELTHFLHRHAARQERLARNRRTAARVGFGALAVLAAVGGSPTLAIELWQIGDSGAQSIIAAQVQGYSRDLEREADETGLKAVQAANYPIGEVPRLFEVLIEEAVGAGNDPDATFVYASHPKLTERLESVRRFLREATDHPPTTGPDPAYEMAIANLLVVNAELDLQVAKRNSARAALERSLAVFPKNGAAYALLGRVHTAGLSQPGSLDAAIAAYENAQRVGLEDAAAMRELGLLLRARGNTRSAADQLRRYLELAPEAADRPLIESYLADLAPEDALP